MAGFVQMVEYRSSRMDEMRAMQDQWRREHPDMGPTRVMVLEDRDRRGTFVAVVEFASYEEAMRNNDDPLTAEFAQRMMALSDGPPTFRNLDLVDVEVRMDTGPRINA